MLLQSDKELELGSRRSRGLVLSAVFHLVLFLAVLASPDFLSTSAQRVIRIGGQEFDRERYDLTELVLPPELMAPETPPAAAPAAPEVAVVPVPLPEVTPEVAAPPPPPPPPPPPEPEPRSEDNSPVPPPPVIGQDDVIEEGARPDAPPPGAETGPETPPRITLNEEIGNRSNAPAGEDGENGISGNGPDSDEAVNAIEESEGAVANDTPNEPRLQNTNPDGLLLPDLRRRANSIVEENLADSRRQAASGRRPGAPGAGDETPDFSTEEPTILSDTRGYDFGPYMNQVVNRVRYNWYSLIPEAARFRQLRGRVVIIFTITKTGIVADERIVADSGSLPLDRAALSSILASNPFPPIPDDFDGDSLVLQFTFLYNVS